MIIRAISSRSPYRRGGLEFDASSARAPDGRPMVEIDHDVMDRIREPGFRELIEDPNIDLLIPDGEGGWTDPYAAAQASAARSPKPKPARKPAAAKGGAGG